jgi:hypothetical protein
MAVDLDKLLDQALRLPPTARAALAGRLLESLDEDVDETAEAEWGLTIEARLKELDRREVKAVPWPEARRAILEPVDGEENP